MSAPGILQRAYRAAVRDAFLLERAESTAASYPASARERMRDLYQMGLRRMNAARDVTEGQPVAAGVLHRDAAIAFIAAIAASRSETVEFRAGDARPALGLLESLLPDRPVPARHDEARRLLSSDDPLVFDHLDERKLRRSVEGVAAFVGWLAETIEPRSVAQIRFLRALRLGLIGTLVLVLVVWGAFKVFSPTNIALHKPTSQSSVHPNSTALPGGLTDGSTRGGYGAHTAAEANPWVRVDLQDLYKLDMVKIYNRTDGWYEDGLPFTLELSENGVDFEVVDHKASNFDGSTPWVYFANGRKARSILVRGTSGKFVALSEIEAYGKK